MPKDKYTIQDMIGGCCVCSDDRGWTENPLVYCDGEGCNVAVHQACYGIVTIPTTNWYCRKCETPDLDQVKCELCPSTAGALKPTDSRGWAHVVCALYIPEVSFGNVTTMEPIIINQIPQERFNKTCYICEEGGKGAIARVGACMQCNRSGCRQVFHVTCAQAQGLLCEEAGNYQDNVKYCGYCHHHYNKLKKGSHVKTIPPYRPLSSGDEVLDEEPKHGNSKRKISSSGSNKGSKNPTGGNMVNSMEGEDSNQLPNGDSPELAKAPISTTNKKRKSNRSSTPGVHIDTSSSGLPTSDSPRPQTPLMSSSMIRPISPSAQTFSSTNGGVTKVGSIVVQVPLEAAGVAGGSSPSPSHHNAASSPPISDSSSSQAPAKRSRSESSDKGEKRKSKRSVSGLPRPHRKSSPSLRVKSSPEHGASISATPSTLTIKLGGTQLSTSLITTGSPIIKEEKDLKLFENGVGAAHMLGNQLAPGSSMADTLSQEMAAHSIYTKASSSHVGPPFPRSTPYRGPGSNSGSGPWGSSGSNMPQTLEQLLERQWEQGSQFLMEQAHHFDIASLLSCLHQLKAENAQLEEHVNSLQARRDNLLAVNARLAIPLVVPHHPPGGNNVGAGGGRTSANSTPASTSASSVATATIASAVLTNASGGTATTAIVENGVPSPHEQFRLSTLHSRVETHRSTIETHRSTVETHRSNVETHRSNVETHRSNVETHRSNVETHRNVAGSLNPSATTTTTYSPSVQTVQTNSSHLNQGSGSLSSSSLHGGAAGMLGTTSGSAHHSNASGVAAANMMHTGSNPGHGGASNPSQHQSGQSSVVVRASSAAPSLPQQASSRSSSSGSYTHGNASFTSGNTQVLLRRSEDPHKPSPNS